MARLVFVLDLGCDAWWSYRREAWVKLSWSLEVLQKKKAEQTVRDVRNESRVSRSTEPRQMRGMNGILVPSHLVRHNHRPSSANPRSPAEYSNAELVDCNGTHAHVPSPNSHGHQTLARGPVAGAPRAIAGWAAALNESTAEDKPPHKTARPLLEARKAPQAPQAPRDKARGHSRRACVPVASRAESSERGVVAKGCQELSEDFWGCHERGEVGGGACVHF